MVDSDLFKSLITPTSNVIGCDLQSSLEHTITSFLTVSHNCEIATFLAALLCLNKLRNPLLYFPFDRETTTLPIGVLLTVTAICSWQKNYIYLSIYFTNSILWNPLYAPPPPDIFSTSCRYVSIHADIEYRWSFHGWTFSYKVKLLLSISYLSLVLWIFGDTLCRFTTFLLDTGVEIFPLM